MAEQPVASTSEAALSPHDGVRGAGHRHDDNATPLPGGRCQRAANHSAVGRRWRAEPLRRSGGGAARCDVDAGGRLARMLLTLALLLVSASPAAARRLPNIYWNSTNPIFRIDNTEHVFQVQILDQVNMICPYLGGDQQFLMAEDELEFSQIYFVSRRAYDQCELDSDARLVGVCQTPHERTEISLVFRSYTPLPGGLEYRPGQSYYFISTSDGSKSGMRQRRGGLCLYKNMKIKFEVLDKNGNMPPAAAASSGEQSAERPAVAAGNTLQQQQHRARHGGKNAVVHARVSDGGRPRAGAADDRPSWLGDAETPVVYANNGPKRTAVAPETAERLESTTPLMYIVHTRPPPAADSAAYGGVDYDGDDSAHDGHVDDDGGGCGTAASSTAVLLLALALSMLVPR